MDPASGGKEEKKRRRRSEVCKKVHCPMSGKVEKCSLGIPYMMSGGSPLKILSGKVG